MIKNIFKNITASPLKKGFAGVAAATAVSRALGYARDIFIASFFGTTMFADAFFVAYRIPNLLRRLLGEGSLPAAFIPVYSGILSEGDEERGKKLAGNFFSFLAVLCLIITAAGIILAPLIVRILAPGFAGNALQMRITVTLTRIMFPILILTTLSTAAMGILNARKYFFIPAAAPALLNLSIISYFLFFMKGGDASDNIRGLAVFETIGFVFYFLLMLPSLLREKVTRLKYIVSDFCGNSDVRRILIALVPAAIGLSVMQFNIFVDTICATFMGEGIVSALYFASRIYQLPLALFGVSISIVSLPFMTDSHAMKRGDELSRNLFTSLSSSFFLIFPSTAGLIICGGEIVKLLFERGNFNPASTAATTSALCYYAAGLLAFAGIKIFANYFYSKKDMKTPVKIASASFLINIVGDILALILKLGAAGLAAATSIAAFFNFIALGIIIYKEGIHVPKTFTIKLLKFILATAVMSVSLIYIPGANVLVKIPAASAIYFLILKILG
ncbi:MAG: murein biosynthesis integral membrane protein MurJ [Elusimicrobia bacterium CG08_land_8_20_14_0_20_44_26]|nr:MAG: murein biosynthesis integral membrane protein MurJ [Elusimicrobia bacterium CG08_land_8_20_14_0_20_44_26]